MKAPRPDYLRVLQTPEPSPQLHLPAIDKPMAEGPAPSEGLTESEKSVWAELLIDAPHTVVRELNLVTFETLVRATVIYREASRNVEKYGSVIKSPSGYPIQSPYVSIMNKQASHILKASNELGLTLRSRLNGKTGNKPKSKANPFEGLKTLADD